MKPTQTATLTSSLTVVPSLQLLEWRAWLACPLPTCRSSQTCTLASHSSNSSSWPCQTHVSSVPDLHGHKICLTVAVRILGTVKPHWIRRIPKMMLWKHTSGAPLRYWLSVLTLLRHEQVNWLQNIKKQLILPVLDVFPPPANLACYLAGNLLLLLSALHEVCPTLSIHEICSPSYLSPDPLLCNVCLQNARVSLLRVAIIKDFWNIRYGMGVIPTGNSNSR